jgi:hypothetical protein
LSCSKAILHFVFIAHFLEISKDLNLHTRIYKKKLLWINQLLHKKALYEDDHISAPRTLQNNLRAVARRFLLRSVRVIEGT